MNFTWFASAYDTDDVAYRLAVFVQIVGVLILAAGVPRRSTHQDFAIVTLGYVVMRVGAGRAVAARRARDPEHAPRLRYAAGIVAARSAGSRCSCARRRSVAARVPRAVAAELAVPVWAERAGVDDLAPAPHRRALRPVHDHRARRVACSPRRCGAVARSTPTALRRARADRRRRSAHRCSRCGGCTSTCRPSTSSTAPRRVRPRTPAAFLWGYGHYFVFATAAAAGAARGRRRPGDGRSERREPRPGSRDDPVALPVSVWLCTYATSAPGPMRNLGLPVGAVAILARARLPRAGAAHGAL